jgi:hypothetical protein
MDDIKAEFEKTQTGLHKLQFIFSNFGAEICSRTQFVDYETKELKATGARIVFIPKESLSKLLRPFALEIGVPAKPTKYHELATDKAFTSLNGDFSVDRRDPENGKYGGGLPLSNGFGALGLSGFKEPDDHLILATAMRECRLLTNSRVRDPQFQEAINDWESALDSAGRAGFKYTNDEIRDWQRLCSDILMKY